MALSLSVSSQLLDTHTRSLLKCKLGALSVNALEFWHARGPSGLAQLAKDLICAPASQCVERIVFVCGLLYYVYEYDEPLCSGLEVRVSLKLNHMKC